MHICVSFAAALLISRSLPIALGISLLEPFIQTACFSLHEYLWEKYRPGSRKTPHLCCAESELVGEIIETIRPKALDSK